MKLEIDVNGDEQINRELLRFSDRAGDASPAFRRIAHEMRDQIGRQFASQGAVGSGGWAPLKPSTLAKKAAEGLSPNILQATGALMESLTSVGAGNREVVTRDSLIFGSSIPYGRYHQSGTSRMPKRRPIEFSETDRRGFMRTLQRYVVTGQT